MAELLSVGLDVGTTTTQMILSRLQVENRASSFAVPQMEIVSREILYESPIHFTPLLDGQRIDGAAIRSIVEKEYARAGICREQVDTGAVIITGETSRKENAKAVLENLAGFAGEFVVTTAGPDLESVLAAKGAGAVRYSEETGQTVLHFDIGGGTSNWALIEAGKILKTGCMNVGGRLIKLDGQGMVTDISPVLEGLTKFRSGDIATEEQIEEVAALLTQGLEMVAGMRERTQLLDKLTTEESSHRGAAVTDTRDLVISFSGGVADCIAQAKPWLDYGDIGPQLGQKIRESRLCKGSYVLGSQTIRATVIGAGCHSAQLSGSTVFYRNVQLPMKNLPVVETIGDLSRLDGPGVLALKGMANPSYDQVKEMAKQIGDRISGQVFVALQADMAKALGHALALRLGDAVPILCIDGVALGEGDFLDVGKPVGPALPVVIKTMIFSKEVESVDSENKAIG